ncbi:hypothetical protein [Calditerricola satsumensis]|uniref:Uncharacterized protein n=1 Tax=Calditerricola satsumensis TaxID=373054 RepID=A0A8J3BGK8_9BACI|nr:hypothetical protein [Calditerricola satsumensis]GGK02146.1 hypothetical protein GCM10007043_15280 [Calditerricola satsumensis]
MVLPLGIALAIKLIPRPIWEELRQQAEKKRAANVPRNWLAGGAILLLWTLVAAWLVAMVDPHISQIAR